MAGRVRLRRVYEDRSPADGTRILVDRLWPRGLSKDAGKVDDWLRAVAPSDGLRRWYGHDPDKFAEFGRRYRAELARPEPAAALVRLRELARSGPVTLVTATRDISRSQAAVLAGELQEEERPGDPACLLQRVCPACGAVAGHDPPVTCPQCRTEITG